MEALKITSKQEIDEFIRETGGCEYGPTIKMIFSDFIRMYPLSYRKEFENVGEFICDLLIKRNNIDIGIITENIKSSNVIITRCDIYDGVDYSNRYIITNGSGSKKIIVGKNVNCFCYEENGIDLFIIKVSRIAKLNDNCYAVF